MNKDIILFLSMTAASIALLQGVVLLMAGRSEVSKRTNRRLAALSANDTREFLRRRTLGEGASPWLATILRAAPIQRVNLLIEQSGLYGKTGYLLVSALAAFCVFTVILNVSESLTFAASLAVSAALTVLLPLLALLWLRDRRRRKIAEQLPEALDMFVRSLRAGHPVPAAIRLVAVEMPAPISIEFASVFDSITYGLDLRDALQRMTERVPIPEFQYMAGAIRIQYIAGGGLAEVLTSLARIMRERMKLYLKVKALSAEARLSGKILAAMPVGIALIIYIVNPAFYAAARGDADLAAVLYFAGFLVGFGIILLQRIVNIRV